MKKQFILLAGIFLFLFCKLQAQSLGVSASLLGYMPKYRPEFSSNYNNDRQIGNAATFTPGIRIEANYMLPGYNFPVTGYNGFGISYFPASTDSTVFGAYLNNGQLISNILSVRKVTQTVIALRFGYEIPQTFNDFLLLHFGIAMGYSSVKYTNKVPEKSNSFQYEISDFDASSLEPLKDRNLHVEPMFGIAYELEHFSILAQYSVMIPLGGYQVGSNSNQPPVYKFKHGASVGIYVPLKQL